jgi:protease-4
MRHSFVVGLLVCLLGYASWDLQAQDVSVAAALAVNQDTPPASGTTAEKKDDSAKKDQDKKENVGAEKKDSGVDKKEPAEQTKKNSEPASDEKKELSDPKANNAAKKDEKPADAKVDSAKPEEKKPDADKPDDKKAKNVQSLALFALDSDLPEGAGQGGLFGDLAPSLHKVIERIDQAAKDKKITGIVLRLQSPTLGSGKVEELRAAVARARKSGKKVYALVDDISNGDYRLATACDEIIMPPSGSVTVSGVRAEVTFYKDLLDKLGVKADMLQVGDFKGAAEPLTRSEMSPEFRKQFETVIDDLYNHLIDTITTERKLDRGRVKDLLDEGLFTAAEAKQAGLIDRVAYEDEFRASLKEQLTADEIKLVEDYAKQKMDVDFSGLGGMMKLMEMMAGGSKAKASGKGKKIAIVYAVGIIMPGESTTGFFEATLGGDTLVKALREAEEDEKVAAIVLRVNSPGGSALASDLVWREVTRIKKPIVASMGDIAASGGYYISMGADKILAEPATITGSIGVVGGKVALGGLFSKIGVKTEIISRGKNSGWESMDQPFTDSERAVWLKIMKDIYKQFTTKAAEGRKMEVAQLESLAQGRIYTGRQAVANRLVDQLGTLDDAVAEAKKLAGIDASEQVEQLILPKPKSLLEELLMGPSLEAKLHARLHDLKGIAPALLDMLDDAARLPRLFSEPGVTVMPFRMRVR